MSASPRDLLKPRSQRLLEVAQGLQQQTGFSDSQYVTFGCVLSVGSTNTQLAISAGEYCLGQGLVQYAGTIAAGVVITGFSIPTLSAGQSEYVLAELDASGTLFLTPGAVVSSGTPVLPAPTATRIAIGYLSLAGAFTPGTTALTAGMLKQVAYDAGNTNPAGTQGINGSSGGF